MTANLFAWDSANNPVGLTLDQLLYRVRSNDRDGLVYDSLTLNEIIADSDGPLAVFDALVTPYSRLERKVSQLKLVMDKSVSDYATISSQVSEPFKQNGSVHVAAVFELTDGQTVSVVFHNPDSTPNKLVASDEMISWKWMLNKKDITIVVAPENGRDLAIREVGRRIMKLAQKNSAAFARMNQKRAEKLENINNLEKECEQLEGKLDGLLQEIKSEQAVIKQRELEEAEKTLPQRVNDVLIAQYGWTVHDVKGLGSAANLVKTFDEKQYRGAWNDNDTHIALMGGTMGLTRLFDIKVTGLQPAEAASQFNEKVNNYIENMRSEQSLTTFQKNAKEIASVLEADGWAVVSVNALGVPEKIKLTIPVGIDSELAEFVLSFEDDYENAVLNGLDTGPAVWYNGSSTNVLAGVRFKLKEFKLSRNPDGPEMYLRNLSNALSMKWVTVENDENLIPTVLRLEPVTDLPDWYENRKKNWLQISLATRGRIIPIGTTLERRKDLF